MAISLSQTRSPLVSSGPSRLPLERALQETTRVLTIRKAVESDLEAIAALVDEYVQNHPAKSHPRPLETLREVYFGPTPHAHLFVAERDGRVVGMAQWRPVFDMFWCMRGAEAEWLYVQPSSRGLGAPAALIAALCADARRWGAEFLKGSGGGENGRLYARVAATMGQTVDCNLSGEAFQVLADLAGAPLREIVRGLPEPALSYEPARPR
jgi:GNAT superfamily N-acetyltransferase